MKFLRNLFSTRKELIFVNSNAVDIAKLKSELNSNKYVIIPVDGNHSASVGDYICKF